jgi:hypothetical protein
MSTAGLTRVERDAGGRRTTFEEIEVGADLGTMDFVVQPEDVQGMLQNDDEAHEWYLGDSPWGAPIVPWMATYPPVRIMFTKKYNVRGLFYIFESDFIRPIFFGEHITLTGRVTKKWIKRDREYVQYEAEGRDASGAIVFRTVRAHALDYLPRSLPRAGEGLDSGRPG